MNQLFASDDQSIRTSALASGVGFIPVILGYKKKNSLDLFKIEI